MTDPVRHVSRLADDQEQGLQIGVVLLGQGVESLVEPLPWVEHHHHGHDGRGELAFGFHEAARLLRGTLGVEALPVVKGVTACKVITLLAIVSTLRYIDCMFKLPDFPSVDFSKFDVDALRSIDFSKYVPSVNLPKVEMPSVDMAAVDVNKLTDAVRDLAYLTVGIGVTVAERAKARRRELATTIVDGYEATKIQLDTVVDQIESAVPGKAATLFGQARDRADAASNQVLALIRTAA